MFIPSVYKKNRGSGQVYSYQQLIESERTLRGPRQRILLNLGTLEIPAAEWKELANRIEALYLGQQEFSRAAVAAEAAQWETVDLAFLSTGDCRTVGGEAVAWQAWQNLGLANIL